MKASELRVGNWVFSKYEKRKVQVTEMVLLDDRYYLFTTHDVEMPLYNFEPIPLTPEILDKCGFTITRTRAQIEYNEFGNIIILNRVDDIYESVYVRTPILYLHQLQNFFFCLVEKELEIKL